MALVGQRKKAKEEKGVQGNSQWTKVLEGILIEKLSNPVTHAVRGEQRREEPNSVPQEDPYEQLKTTRQANGVNRYLCQEKRGWR